MDDDIVEHVLVDVVEYVIDVKQFVVVIVQFIEQLDVLIDEHVFVVIVIDVIVIDNDGVRKRKHRRILRGAPAGDIVIFHTV